MKKKKKAEPPPATEDAAMTEPSEFDRFKSLVEKVVTVPKSELDEKRNEGQ